jgi:hypothetical protein
MLSLRRKLRKRDLAIESVTLLEPHRSRVYRPCELKHAGGVINKSARRGISASMS